MKEEKTLYYNLKKEDLKKEYLEKLRIIYENGMPSIIEMLINSKGITDFIRKINVYTSILEYYQNKSGSIKNQKEYIDYIKKDMVSKKLQVEQLKKDVEKSTNELSSSLETKKKKVLPKKFPKRKRRSSKFTPHERKNTQFSGETK